MSQCLKSVRTGEIGTIELVIFLFEAGVTRPLTVTGGAGMLESRLPGQHILRHGLFAPLMISIGILVVLAAALVFGVVTFGWGWTGFTGGYSQEVVKGTTEDTVYLASKTLWDWMQLLLVPVMLVVGGVFLTRIQKGREEKTAARWERREREAVERRTQADREIAERRAQTDREIAADHQREAALQSSIDKIGELLLREHLGESPGQQEVENLARARTVTALQILDRQRRASLLRFLGRAGILRICTEGQLARVDLHETNLSQFDLSQFNLSDADLSGTNLSGTDLGGADLRGARLRGANLIEANLSGANLSETDLSDAYLSYADLRRTTIRGADLRGATLEGADLSGARLHLTDLGNADLSETRLNETDFNGANLRGAKFLMTDLSEVDLSGAKR
jgi:uncharacterized protein YjbI with pentapeptide repeats